MHRKKRAYCINSITYRMNCKHLLVSALQTILAKMLYCTEGVCVCACVSVTPFQSVYIHIIARLSLSESKKIIPILMQKCKFFDNVNIRFAYMYMISLFNPSYLAYFPRSTIAKLYVYTQPTFYLTAY